jgi:hypothetical protein
MDEESRLLELGFNLPDLTLSPSHFSQKLYGAHLIPNRKVGDLLFTACVPNIGSEAYYTGTIGITRTREEGYKASQIAAVSAIAGIKYALRDLDRVKNLIRVFHFTVCSPGFSDLSFVGNGSSHVFHHVFGDRGRHIRVDVGMTGLCGGHSVELVLITQFRV